MSDTSQNLFQIETAQEGETRVARTPKILAGAWISQDFIEEEYAEDDPFNNLNGDSQKLEATSICDKFIIRVQTQGIPADIAELSIDIQDKDILFHDKMGNSFVIKRVEKEGSLSNIFQGEIIIPNEEYKNAYDTVLEGDVLELFFTVKSSDFSIADKQYELNKKFDKELLKIDRRNLQLYLCPRKADNLFIKEKLENEDLEENERFFVKEYLKDDSVSFKKSTSQSFDDSGYFADFKEIFKEVEYNYYLDFAKKHSFRPAEYWCLKNIAIIPIKKFKNQRDDEEKECILDSEIEVKISREMGSRELRFLVQNQILENVDSIKLKPNKSILDKSIIDIVLAHPLLDPSNNDKKIKINVAMNEFENITDSISLNIKRNKDTSLQDVGINELGNYNLSDEEPNGFFIREIVDGDNDFSTNSNAIQRLQKLLVYDLDTRRRTVEDQIDGENRVDGHFRKYIQPGGDNHNTAIHLKDFITSWRKAAWFKPAKVYPFADLGIYTCLKDFLKEEYGYEYVDGEIIDKKLCLGTKINCRNPDDIDGIFEILLYNEFQHQQHMNNQNLCQTIGHGSTRTTSEFMELLGNDNDGNWYDVKSVNDQGQVTEEILVNNYRPVWIEYSEARGGGGRYVQRNHNGIDRAGGSEIRSPMYITIRKIEPYESSNFMKINIELIGLGRTIRIVHLEYDSSVKAGYHYYPTEKITKFPTKKDSNSTGPHIHIEKWRIKWIRDQQLFMNPDTDALEPTGTEIYWRNFDKLNQAAYTGRPNTNLPRYYRQNGRDGVYETQPQSPFD